MSVEFAPYAQPSRPGPNMGLRPIPLAEWLARSNDHRAYIAAKRRRLDKLGGVGFMALPGSEAAQTEAAALIRSHLRPSGRGDPRKAARTKRAPHAPLAAAAMRVEEDLCVMAPDADQRYRLVAGSVASPSFWRLADKMGQELIDIHDRVAGLRARLGPRMARFFQQLPADRVYMRGNWFVHACPEPFGTPDDARPRPVASPGGVADLFLRCERQTLRRLPATGAVLFAIRVYLTPVTALAAWPSHAAALRRGLGDAEALAYRTHAVPQDRDALLDWLRQVAGGEPQPDRARRGPGRRQAAGGRR